MAPPDREPQPKLLTAHTSEPTTVHEDGDEGRTRERLILDY